MYARVVVVNAQATAFAPAARPQVVIAGDGTLGAIHEPSRVVVVEVPSCSPFAELGVDVDATSTDVAWVGTPPRLLVLSRYGAHSMAYLVDPFGPRTIAEMRLEAPMKLFASVGNHALVIGPLGAGLHGAAVIAATERALLLHQLPARTQPVAAGAAGANFLIALAGMIEEWDPQNRMPKRRLKLTRPVAVTAVGGSDRVVWMTTREDPTRIDVMPLVNRGQPKAHDLPEPIASVSSHPRSDLLVCVGATSGRVWVIDLDGRHGLRMVGPEGIDRVESAGLVLGRVTGVLAAQAQHPITIVGLDRDSDTSGPVTVARESSGAIPRDLAKQASGATPFEVAKQPSGAVPFEVAKQPSGAVPFEAAKQSSGPIVATGATAPSSLPSGRPRPAPFSTPRTREASTWPEPTPMTDLVVRSTLSGEDDVEAVPTSVTLSAPPMPESVAHDGQRSDSGPSRAADSFANARRLELAVTAMPREQGAVRPSTTDAQLAAWRARIRGPRARTVEALTQFWPDAPPTWRDDALAWARSALAGSVDGPGLDGFELSAESPFATLVARFDLSAQLQPVLALLYGLHLAGIDGASPAELARFTGTWDEALGRGELAQRGVALYRDSRVVLAPSVQRVLDDLSPATGTLVGIPGICSLLGPCAIVASSPLSITAEACSSSIGGAILAAHDGADPAELAREARAYGAAPMLRVVPADLERVSTDDPIILVVDDDATADALAIPRLT